MADQHAAERIRRLSVIIHAEREIAGATRVAYADLLAQIAADILDDVAVVAALPDTKRNRNQINAAWIALLAFVRRPIARLFEARFLGSGARRHAMQVAEDRYLAGIEGHLKGVPGEVYRDLDRIVSEGVRSGLTEAEIRASLAREITPGHAEYEARLKAISTRVARTEATSAFNAGEQAGWNDIAAEQNSRLTKRWLSSHDQRVRPTHVEADGQVVAADQPFSVGGYPAQYPGDFTLPPEESVNCRCTAVYSTDAVVATLGVTVTTPDNQPLPDGWRGPIAALDVETGDKRMLGTPADGLKTRDYPMSLTLGHVGDGEAPVIGSIDRVWGQDGELWGEGKNDLGGAEGADWARQLRDGFINSVSIHPANVTAEIQLVLADGTVLVGEDAQKAYEDNDYQLPEGSHDRMAMTDWVFAGLAVVPIPAYTQARIEGVYDYVPSGPQKGDATIVMQEGIVAAIGGQVFKRANFERVATGPTPLTVTEDGAIYGHVREYGTCYQYGGGRGDGGYCVEPPLSACSYSKFHCHGAKMDDGSIMRVGALTYGEGHESRGGLNPSVRHYNEVATMAAKIVASEDQWGVWICGEVLDSHREKAYDLLLSPMSGHWEPDADNGNHLEMLAVHVVVTPGYSVGRIVASYGDTTEPTSIVVTTYPSRQNRTVSGTQLPSARAAVVAAMRDVSRAERAAKRIGIDPASRLARAMERINPR